ncbi:MAG TPA: hypothetical protein VFW11_15510 [Cyclobacteriaceae bacterium]|nr:hypothetical protein [Cyclobacteriaceae bacterium]
MTKYFLSVLIVLSVYCNSLAQVESFDAMRRRQQVMAFYQPLSLKSRNAPKDKWKHGYIVNLENDTIECTLTVKGKKYFIESDDGPNELVASAVKAVSYLDLNEGNVVLYSLPFHRNMSVEGYFFKVVYKDNDFLLVRNEEKIIKDLICQNETDYLSGLYFLDLENKNLVAASKKALLLLTSDYEPDIKLFLEQQNNKLKKEWDFIEVLLRYNSLKYPSADKY